LPKTGFDPNTNTTTLVFQQWNWDVALNLVLSQLTSTVSQRFVEADIFCNWSSCEATAVRPTNPIAVPDNVPDDMTDQEYFMEWLFSRMAYAFPLTHSGTPESGGLENMLNNYSRSLFMDPDDGEVLLYTVGADVLSVRLSQIINTYWNVEVFGNNVAGNSDIAQKKFDPGLTVFQSDAVMETPTRYFHCDRRWLALFILATVSMIATSISSFGLNFLRHTPISTDFLTALVKGQLSDVGESLGSYLDSDEMTRRLKRFRLMIGDSRPKEKVGRVVITQSVRVDRLHNGRVYQ
jgi:hypothetical protein